MKIVQVYEVDSDIGMCKILYRTVPNKQLICTLEQSENVFEWQYCTDDNCWNEPISAIDMDKYSFTIIPKKEALDKIKAHKTVIATST